jgi:hypothetical protein
MATKYADRAFLSVNGARIADLESAELRQNFNAREVPTMSPDGFNRGYVEGNRTIDITATIANQNQLARPKLEAIDFENNDIQITWIVGSDQFVATGVFRKDVSDNAGGVGDEVKTSFSFGALRLTDTTGNSSLFSLSL